MLKFVKYTNSCNFLCSLQMYTLSDLNLSKYVFTVFCSELFFVCHDITVAYKYKLNNPIIHLLHFPFTILGSGSFMARRMTTF